MSDLHALPWPRRTERLTIRPVTHDDVDTIWQVRQHADVSEWIPSPGTLEEFRVRGHSEEFQANQLAVELQDVLIGDLMLRRGDAWAQAERRQEAAGVQAELGWAFDPAYGGRGLATEAVRDLIAVCLSAPPDGLGLHRVVATCFTDNTPSWRLMERLGMRREAHTRQDSLHRTRGWLDGYDYALLAAEWPTHGQGS